MDLVPAIPGWRRALIVIDLLGDVISQFRGRSSIRRAGIGPLKAGHHGPAVASSGGEPGRACRKRQLPLIKPTFLYVHTLCPLLMNTLYYDVYKYKLDEGHGGDETLETRYARRVRGHLQQFSEMRGTAMDEGLA